MDSLPSELLGEILSYLTYRKDRMSAVGVSRLFQQIIEPIHFSHLRISNQDLPAFSAFFQGAAAHRRDVLRQLSYRIILPGYPPISCGDYESKETMQENNVVFTEAILALFHELSSWDIDQVCKPCQVEKKNNCQDPATQQIAPVRELSFSIFDIHSSSDIAWRSALFTAQHRTSDIETERYRFSYLRLTAERLGDPEGNEGDGNGAQIIVPRVLRITSFSVASMHVSDRRIEGATMVQLAASMPNLRHWDLSGGDNCTNFPIRRQQMRIGFGQRLLSCCHDGVFNNLKHLSLCLSSPEQIDHDLSVSALHSDHPMTDFLSVAFHTLSRLPHIKKFILGISTQGISLSPRFFWPEDLSDDDSGPRWPSLEVLSVVFSPHTPSGGWYIKRGHTPLTQAGQQPSTLVYAEDSYRPKATFRYRYRDNDIWDSDPEFEYISDENGDPSLEETHGADKISIWRTSGAVGKPRVNMYRTILDSETFSPLMISLAKAVRKMEKLSSLYFQLSYWPLSVLKVAFHKSLVYPRDDFFTCEYLRSGFTKAGLLWSEDDDDQIVLKNRWMFEVRKSAMWNVLDEGDSSAQGVRRALRDAVGQDGLLKVKVIGTKVSRLCSLSPPWVQVDRNPQIEYKYL